MQDVIRIARRPLHEEAVDRLRDLIVQGRLSPGERLNERLLCERLGISRTPLREAIKLLATEGLVELLPNRGAVVSAVDPDRIAEALTVMGALEALAGELACGRASGEAIAAIRALHNDMLSMHSKGDLDGYFRYNQLIHMGIVEASGNPVLASTYRQLNANVKRARYMANLSRERWDAAVAEHEEIIRALERRDATALRGLLADHLSRKLAHVTKSLRSRAAA
ncbi:MAG TPA: GntR family transcriptional regulator [Burkholderiales bacterium]|nr:GntR family transcriptional regulator [Burkholderiales bacterium]